MPLLVALRLIPFTVTRITAVVSFTVPVRGGVASVVVRLFTVTVGATVSTVSSLVVLSVPTFPATSVAVATTLYVLSARVLKAPLARDQVVPLLVAVRV